MSYVTDPIGDLLTRMRNAQHARRETCVVSWSKIKQQLCELMVREEWIASVSVIGEAPKQDLEITFHPEKTALELKRISKPGRRIYQGSAELKPHLSGYGTLIITTSEGLLTDKEARKRKIGGEVLCTIS